MRRLGVFALMFCLSTALAHAADAPGQEFVVFFQQWSAALDDSAQSGISHAADYVKAHPGNIVHVNGFADPTGSRRANELVTDLRAQMVADQLQADGVDAKRIRQRGRGAVQFALSSQESRRVEISISRH